MLSNVPGTCAGVPPSPCRYLISAARAVWLRGTPGQGARTESAASDRVEICDSGSPCSAESFNTWCLNCRRRQLRWQVIAVSLCASCVSDSHFFLSSFGPSPPTSSSSFLSSHLTPATSYSSPLLSFLSTAVGSRFLHSLFPLSLPHAPPTPDTPPADLQRRHPLTLGVSRSVPHHLRRACSIPPAFTCEIQYIWPRKTVTHVH
jgi:hypothetical protein